MSPFVEKLGERFAGIRIDPIGETRELSLFLPASMPVDIDQDGIAHAIAYTLTGGVGSSTIHELALAREPSVIWQIAMPERRMYDHTREVWIEQKSQRSGYKIEVRYRLEDISPELISPEAIEEARTLVKASKGRAK